MGEPRAVCAELLPQCAQRASSRCVWGPSYWCATPFHALTCGTTEICKKTVWKTLSVRVEEN